MFHVTDGEYNAGAIRNTIAKKEKVRQSGREPEMRTSRSCNREEKHYNLEVVTHVAMELSAYELTTALHRCAHLERRKLVEGGNRFITREREDSGETEMSKEGGDGGW